MISGASESSWNIDAGSSKSPVSFNGAALLKAAQNRLLCFTALPTQSHSGTLVLSHLAVCLRVDFREIRVCSGRWAVSENESIVLQNGCKLKVKQITSIGGSEVVQVHVVWSKWSGCKRHHVCFSVCSFTAAAEHSEVVLKGPILWKVWERRLPVAMLLCHSSKDDIAQFWCSSLLQYFIVLLLCYTACILCSYICRSTNCPLGQTIRELFSNSHVCLSGPSDILRRVSVSIF